MCARRQAATVRGETVGKDQQKKKEPASSGKRYVTSLDGFRALCALGVVFYHMGLSWCSGGLLGVTVLFVLSGYLAMGGLMHEFEKAGTISCGKYYLKRVKRLLPTAIVYVIVTAALCTLFNHQLLTKMRSDVIPALLMVLNWYKIISKQSYFAAAGAPSPLTHFWSLAIEFEFYLIWPPILLLLLRKKASKKHMVAGLAVAAILSAVAMALLYVPEADPSRAYYGTDTRAQSLLIGCLLELIWPFGDRSSPHVADMDGKRRLAIEIGGVASVVALLVMMGVTEGYTSFSYYGGTFACSVIAAVAIACLVPQGTAGSRVMSVQPLVWIGKRSFAIYIWHYLVVQLLTPRNAGIGLTWWQVILQLVVTLILAELSYRFVEEPLRRHSLRAGLRHDFLKRWRPAGEKGREVPDAHQRRPREAAAPSGLAGVLEGIQAKVAQSPVKISSAAVAAAFVVCALCGLAFVPDEAVVGGEPGSSQVSAATLKKPLVDGVYDVVFIGDSVSLGAADKLNAAFPHGLVDAAVSRQASEALDIYNGYAEQGVVGDTVIFSVGTNGALDEATLESIYDAVGSGRQLWFVNDRTPRDWCTANNTLLADFAASHEHVGVIDWYGASADHGEWFWDDQTHLRPEYAQEFANLVVSTIGYEVPTGENTTYSVVFLGDEVSMQAADKLASAWPDGMVDCAAGRNTEALANAWQGYVDAGTAGHRLVLVPGGSVPLDSGRLASFLDSISSDVQVWLVTSRSSAAFADANNQILQDAASSRDNVSLADWAAASEGHPEYFGDDASQLSEEGIDAYVATITEAVGDVSAADANTDADASEASDAASTSDGSGAAAA